MSFPARLLVTLAAMLLGLQLALVPAWAAEPNAETKAVQTVAATDQTTSSREPRAFRGNALILATGGTLVFLALFFIFRALRSAKRENTPKAWHE